jgi:putative SOS response-associated peptidase YedK
MCGRFTQSYTWRELVELYQLTRPALNLRPRYNIAPTTAIGVVRPAEGGLELVSNALGPHSWLVEKDCQGSSLDAQRASRNRR